MSELINTNDNRTTIRWKLLTGASALALAAYISCATPVRADDTDRPLIWIELGGQLDRIGGKEDPFLPLFALKPLAPFSLQTPTPDIYSPTSPAGAQKPVIYAFGEEGKITFQPEGSKWDFSASIRYGRSSNTRNVHQQADVSSQYPNALAGLPGQPAIATLDLPLFADFKARNTESHTIVDFQVGRDVGLGGFSSSASLGVRVADFTSSSQIGMIVRPDMEYIIVKGGTVKKPRFFHQPVHTDYIASAHDERNFHGIGPSISWSGDVPIAGNEDGALTIDWGVNAAAIFGRQHAKGSHTTSALEYKGGGSNYPTQVYNHPPLTHDRTRSVVVPNAGATAAISFRYPGAKISFGYRADFFLNAMDVGIDARQSKDRNFYGPFATISIGLGD